jgi:peptidoglycan/LPS O-acetylase OafA/YrhL
MKRRSPARRLALLALGAMVLYGAWAAWANHGHGSAASVRAFFVQGGSSAFTTTLIGSVVEAGRRWLGSGRGASIVASIGGACAAVGFHVTMNLIAHTPELLRTITPSAVMAFVFAGVYASASRAQAESKNEVLESVPGPATEARASDGLNDQGHGERQARDAQDGGDSGYVPAR